MIRFEPPSPNGSTGPMITAQVPSSARRPTPCLAAPESHAGALARVWSELKKVEVN